MIEIGKNSHQNSDNLKLIETLLEKDDFYVLKDYPNELRELINLLIQLIYVYFETVKNKKKIYEIIGSILNKLKRKIEKFPESVQCVQECLFLNIFCKPIEINVNNDDSFYRLIFFDSNLIELVELKYINAKTSLKSHLDRLLVQINSTEFLDSIQPDQATKYDFRVRFYESWFGKLGNLIKYEATFDSIFIEQLCLIIDKCIGFDAYVNPFDSTCFTVNYNIIESISSAFSNQSVPENLINKLIQAWLIIVDLKHNLATERFFMMIQMASINHLKLLVPITSRLWDLYLDRMTEYNLQTVINSLMPLTHEYFMKERCARFSSILLDKFEEVFNITYQLLMTILKSCPEFFFVQQKKQKERLFLIEMINRAKQLNTDVNSLMTISLGLLSMVVQNLKENHKLISRFIVEIYEQRMEFWNIILDRLDNSNNNGLLIIFKF